MSRRTPAWCRRVGSKLTIDAIRYYEREQLLDERHITRLSNGYHSFTPAAIERLQHLKHARAGLYGGRAETSDHGV